MSVAQQRVSHQCTPSLGAVSTLCSSITLLSYKIITTTADRPALAYKPLSLLTAELLWLQTPS